MNQQAVNVCLICGFTTHSILSFWTDRSGQTVQTQIRPLLEERSDQGLHCLQFSLHTWKHFSMIKALVQILGWLQQIFLVSEFLGFLRYSQYCAHASNWAKSSEFVSSSIPSWQILTAHAQPFRGARDLAFCLTVPLDSLLVWASRGVSGETAQMGRLTWTFAAPIGDKYQIRLTRSNW